MTTIGYTKSGTVGASSVEVLTGNDLDTRRSGIILRNTSSAPMYFLVGSVYTSTGNLTTATGKFVPANSERVILADPTERVFLLGTQAGQSYVIEQFRGTVPGVSI